MDLLFDLDGTLTDPEQGITRCIQHAVTSLGWPAPPRESLHRYIGPPLRQTFATLLGTDDDVLIRSAITHYRERFSEVGLYENEVYVDVPGSLQRLREDGHRLWVATSKPEIYARRIIDHFGLTPHFQRVHGSELSGERADKTDLIAHVLKLERLQPNTVFMIGDRAPDITGGRANGTRTIGVLWGYGSEQEIRGAKPDVVVDAMAPLIAHVTNA
jgi:phosphoglycolate phosphatase